MLGCELCNPQKETEGVFDLPEGFEFNVFRCRTHHEFMIVSRHHGGWEPGEKEMAEKLRDILFPGKEIRWEMRSVPDHAHCHVIGT